MSASEFLTWAQLAGVVVTAFATAALVWFTAVLARETRRLAAAGSQPQIILTIEASEDAIIFLNSIIQNTGTAAAYDIRIEFDPPIEFIPSGTTKRVPLNKISVLKPGQGISSFLCRYDELVTKRFTIRIHWKRHPHGLSEEGLSYEIDISHMEGMIRLGTPPLHEIADSVKTLAKDFGYAV